MAGIDLRRQLSSVGVVFANPGLRDCQLALALARIVDLAQLVAVSAYLYGQGGAGPVAAYGVIRALAAAIGVPAITSATGRFGHGGLLRILGFVAAVATAGMAIAMFAAGPVPAVLMLAGVGGLAIGTFRPICSALMPSLVTTPEELVACNAATGLLDGASTLVGPLLAGGLLGLLGPDWAVVVTAVILVATGILSGQLPVPAAMPPVVEDSSPLDGVRTFVTTPQTRLLGILGMLQTAVRGAMNVILVALAIDLLRVGEPGLGVLFAALGVGGLIGLPITLVVIRRQSLYRSFGLGLILFGAPLALTGAVPVFAVALLLFAIIGIGNDFLDVSCYSAIPRAVPDHLLARILGVLESAYQIGMALGAAVAGVLLAALDIRLSLVIVGLVLPVCAIACIRWFVRFDRALGTRDAEVDLLRAQPLFAPLPMPVLDNLASRLEVMTFTEGEVVMRQGEEGDRYVLIVDGTVAISKDSAQIASLGPGEAFGEIALVRNTPRTATAVASSGVEARTLDRAAFLAALGCDPRAWAAAESVADVRQRRDAGA
jgi:MFS family permease